MRRIACLVTAVLACTAPAAIAQDPVALGEAAISQLVERIQAPLAPVRTVLLSASLVSRGSTAAPPRAGR